jgi:hypothetical protein
MGIEQGREASEISDRELTRPGGLQEDLLDHQGIDVDQTDLQEMQREHRDLLIVESIFC